MATDPDSGQHSPAAVNNRHTELTTQWARVVRGDSDPINIPDTAAQQNDPASASTATAAGSSPPQAPEAAVDDGNNGNAAAAKTKKPAWNKPSPSNGVVVGAGAIMGAESWPALSESTKPSPKSSTMGTTADASSSKGSVNGSTSSSSQKQGSSSANPNAATGHTSPTPSPRPKSMKRGNGNPGIGSSQNSFPYPAPPPPPPLPPFPPFQLPPPNGFGIMTPPPPPPDISPRELHYRGNYRNTRPVGGFASQGGNDHRNSSRRGNFVPHPRGDGSYHHNHRNRRDQDRGNGNARDVHMQNQRPPPRPLMRPLSPNAAPLIPPQPVRPFANPMGYTDFVYVPALPLEPYRGMPVIPPPPPMMMPEEPTLPELLLKQIEYYFSDDNLAKDSFLKSNMDDHGWVPLSLIADFPRVKNMTDDVQLILDSLRSSIVVEVQDDRMRRRNDWMKWVHPSSRRSPDTGLMSSGESSGNTLETSLQRLTVVEAAANQDTSSNNSDTCSGTQTGKSTSETSGQSSLPNGECSDAAGPSQN